MFYYFLAGVIVQLIITLTRIMRGVVPSLDGFGSKDWTIFIATFVVGGVINATIWPAAIVFEIINVKNGV